MNPDTSRRRRRPRRRRLAWVLAIVFSVACQQGAEAAKPDGDPPEPAPLTWVRMGKDLALRPVGERINDLAIGPTGSLWVATDKGLSQLVQGRFRHFTMSQGLPDNEVSAVVRWGDGVAGATGGGLVWIPEPTPEKTRIKARQSGEIASILVDGEKLWCVGSDPSGKAFCGYLELEKGRPSTDFHYTYWERPIRQAIPLGAGDFALNPLEKPADSPDPPADRYPLKFLLAGRHGNLLGLDTTRTWRWVKATDGSRPNRLDVALERAKPLSIGDVAYVIGSGALWRITGAGAVEQVVLETEDAVGATVLCAGPRFEGTVEPAEAFWVAARLERHNAEDSGPPVLHILEQDRAKPMYSLPTAPSVLGVTGDLLGRIWLRTDRGLYMGDPVRGEPKPINLQRATQGIPPDAAADGRASAGMGSATMLAGFTDQGDVWTIAGGQFTLPNREPVALPPALVQPSTNAMQTESAVRTHEVRDAHPETEVSTQKDSIGQNVRPTERDMAKQATASSSPAIVQVLVKGGHTVVLTEEDVFVLKEDGFRTLAKIESPRTSWLEFWRHTPRELQKLESGDDLLEEVRKVPKLYRTLRLKFSSEELHDLEFEDELLERVMALKNLSPPALPPPTISPHGFVVTHSRRGPLVLDSAASDSKPRVLPLTGRPPLIETVVPLQDGSVVAKLQEGGLQRYALDVWRPRGEVADDYGAHLAIQNSIRPGQPRLFSFSYDELWSLTPNGDREVVAEANEPPDMPSIQAMLPFGDELWVGHSNGLHCVDLSQGQSAAVGLPGWEDDQTRGDVQLAAGAATFFVLAKLREHESSASSRPYRTILWRRDPTSGEFAAVSDYDVTATIASCPGEGCIFLATSNAQLFSVGQAGDPILLPWSPTPSDELRGRGRIAGMLPDPDGKGALLGFYRGHSPLVHIREGAPPAFIPLRDEDLSDDGAGRFRNAMFRDSEGRVWVGARRRLWMRPNDDAPFECVRMEDGEPFRAGPNAILQDSSARLWLACSWHDSLWCIEPGTSSPRKVEQTTETLIGLALTESPRPRLWYGGNRGLLRSVDLDGGQPKDESSIIEDLRIPQELFAPIENVAAIDEDVWLLKGRSDTLFFKNGKDDELRSVEAPFNSWRSSVDLEEGQVLFLLDDSAYLLADPASSWQSTRGADLSFAPVTFVQDGSSVQLESINCFTIDPPVEEPKPQAGQVYVVADEFIWRYDSRESRFLNVVRLPQAGVSSPQYTLARHADSFWLGTDRELLLHEDCDDAGVWQYLLQLDEDDSINAVLPIDENSIRVFTDKGTREGSRKTEKGASPKAETRRWWGFGPGTPSAIRGEEVRALDSFTVAGKQAPVQGIAAGTEEGVCLVSWTGSIPQSPEAPHFLHLDRASGLLLDNDVTALHWTPTKRLLWVGNAMGVEVFRIGFDPDSSTLNIEPATSKEVPPWRCGESEGLPRGRPVTIRANSSGTQAWFLIKTASLGEEPESGDHRVLRWDRQKGEIHEPTPLQFAGAQAVRLGPAKGDDGPPILIQDGDGNWREWKAHDFLQPDIRFESSLIPWSTIRCKSLQPQAEMESPAWDVEWFVDRLANAADPGWFLKEIWSKPRERFLLAKISRVSPDKDAAPTYVVSKQIQHMDHYVVIAVWVLLGVVAIAVIVVPPTYVTKRRRREKERIRLIERQENPYVIGRPVTEPKHCYGREELLESLKNTIAANDWALTGELRIGKTTVQMQLGQILREVEDKQYVYLPVFVDAQWLQENPDLGLFRLLGTQAVRTAVEEHQVPSELIEKLKISQSADKNSRSVYSGLSLADDLERLLEFYRTKFPSREPLLVLQIDEIQVLEDIEYESLSGLRALLIDNESVRAVLSGVKLPKRQEEPASPWWNVFKQREILPLTPAEARRLVTEPAKRLFTFSTDAIERIIGLGECKPKLIQELCMDTLNYKYHTKKTGKRITERDVLEAREFAAKTAQSVREVEK